MTEAPAESEFDLEFRLTEEGEGRTRVTGQGARWRRGSVAPPELVSEPIESASPILPPSARTLLDVTDVLVLVNEQPTVPADSANPKGLSSRRRIAVRELLSWLHTIPGLSWQERWTASGIESDPAWSDTIIHERNQVTGLHYQRGYVTHAVTWMAALDIIRPSYEWMHREHEVIRGLHQVVFELRDPAGGRAIDEAIERTAALANRKPAYKVSALSQLARVLVHTGKQRVSEISPADLIEVRESARGQRNLPSGAAYNAMSWAGFLPEGAPRAFVETRRTAQLSAEQLVDRTGIQNVRIRNLFVDYLRARGASYDYTTIAGLAGTLVRNFWVEIEHLSPGIDTLSLSSELIADWKESISIIQHGTKAGKKRESIGPILVAVRAFYVDINDWAQADPDRYGEFAARNPIGPEASRGLSKSKRQQRARSHARTRARLPLLPKLMATVEHSMRWHKAVLEESSGRTSGERFDVEGVACEIVSAEAGKAFGARILNGHKRGGGQLVARRLDTDELFDVVNAEAVHFWRWAAINVLNEAGLRIEELEELTHTSIVEYHLPSTGELLPLLQIAPSKTDQERVLVISPELATVLAAIIARIRIETGSDALPLLKRWDSQEKIESDPMPFLFQRIIDGERRCVNRAWILRHLRQAVLDAHLIGDDGEPVWFQNHDLRRLFATDAVMSGLPIHIAAEVLGHESLGTTQGYVAIYDEEVYKHHRAFIERRRALRPSVEYREPTSAEWEEFLGHFERRQMELGVCGRAYGTACVHEFACMMCSMLRPDPEQEPRLLSMVDSLNARLAEAHKYSWLGEIEKLEHYLVGAQQKLDSMHRQTQDGKAWLGLPTLRAGGGEAGETTV